MFINEPKLKTLARDLRKEEPRAPEEELAGFPFAARCLDKCRATLVGWQGEFTYACPMDQRFLQTADIGADEFKEFVATGVEDDEVERWIGEHSHAPR
ncbi:MAG: uncharacterized protein JWM68_5564 [Verrucomicrobiales bacterium]|nr:uncharacterized protein [Verrucomicrobiales bacterium]